MDVSSMEGFKDEYDVRAMLRAKYTIEGQKKHHRW